MAPKDKLEEDFKFYLSFFERNLKELRDEEDRALCQEWLQRLEEMGETRKQRRDRNVWLSQLVLAMGEGRLPPPFDAPPPQELLPLSASLFVLLEAGLGLPEKSQTDQSEKSMPSTRPGTSVKHTRSADSGKETNRWNFNMRQDPEDIVSLDSQTSQLEMPFLTTKSDNTMELLSETTYEDDDNRWIHGILLSPDEYMFLNQQALFSEGPPLYTRFDSSLEQLSDTDNEERRRKWFSDKQLAANSIVSRKSQTSSSGVPPSISSGDISVEDLPTVVIRSKENKQSNETSSTAGELELESTNLSEPQTHKISNDRINPIQGLDPNRTTLPFPKFSKSRTNILSKGNFNAERDLDLQRPVLSRTCPRPSQMPLVQKRTEPHLANAALLASQWSKIVTVSKDAHHGNSMESLLSYSKGQWVDELCDSESYKSAFSVQSVSSGKPSETKGQSGPPSVSSEPHHHIRRSEVLIQSLSLGILEEESCQNTPSLSVTSLGTSGKKEQEKSRGRTPAGSFTSECPKAKHEDSPTPSVQSGRNQFTQTESEYCLPKENNFYGNPMYLPVYIVSADQQSLFLRSPVVSSQIGGRQMVIPNFIQFPHTSQHSHHQQRPRKS